MSIMSEWIFVKFYIWKFYRDLLTLSDLFLISKLLPCSERCMHSSG